MTDKPSVVILGGGFAALETAFLLRMRTHDACEITIVADRDRFLFRPNTIYIPFGADPEHFYVELAKPLERRGITLERGAVADVDPQDKQVALDDGRFQQVLDFLRLGKGFVFQKTQLRREF